MNLEPVLPVYWKKKGPYLEKWNEKTPEECLQLTCKWTENFALRLDNYVSIDPDTPEAQKIVDQWDADGLLPATVCWRTARGIVRRLFKPIPGTKRMEIPGIKLDLRHGNQFCDIIPPSYVVDESKGIKGTYEWVAGHDPGSIEVAPLPQFVLDFFKENTRDNGNSLVFNKMLLDKVIISKEYARELTLEEPGRDNSLFSIALSLFKGGTKYPDVEYIIRNLGQVCIPPFHEKDCSKKVESAFKRFQGGVGGNIAAEVREWVSVTPGAFNVTQTYIDLGCVTTRDKAAVRKALQRMVEDGLIMPIEKKKGLYRPIEREMNRIKLSEGVVGEEIEIKYPFHLERHYRTFPKTVMLVCGEPDAGKSAFLLNFVHKNLYESPLEINYFTSEMGPAEMFDRAANIPGFDATEWDKRVKIWERSSGFEDVVNPNGINLIDFLEIHEDFFQVGDLIYKIWSKLSKGIAIIALQQDPDKANPKGGIAAREKPRLAITLRAGKKDKPNVMVIDKIKNWRNRLHNPKNLEIEFKLINGVTFRTIDNEAL
jgi:hypothetical protein